MANHSRKDEIFGKILDIVCEEMEVSKEEILSKSRQDYIVDARTVFAKALKVNGFSVNSIAYRLDKTKAGINNILYGFSFRKESKMIQINLEYIKSALEEIGLCPV